MVEMLIPEALVHVGPSRNFAQWLAFKVQDVVASLPCAPDQAGALQNLDVLGDSIE